jgi:hypothetical protein
MTYNGTLSMAYDATGRLKTAQGHAEYTNAPNQYTLVSLRVHAALVRLRRARPPDRQLRAIGGRILRNCSIADGRELPLRVDSGRSRRSLSWFGRQNVALSGLADTLSRHGGNGGR